MKTCEFCGADRMLPDDTCGACGCPVGGVARARCPHCGMPTIQDADDLHDDDMLCDRCYDAEESCMNKATSWVTLFSWADPRGAREPD